MSTKIDNEVLNRLLTSSSLECFIKSINDFVKNNIVNYKRSINIIGDDLCRLVENYAEHRKDIEHSCENILKNNATYFVKNYFSGRSVLHKDDTEYKDMLERDKVFGRVVKNDVEKSIVHNLIKNDGFITISKDGLTVNADLNKGVTWEVSKIVDCHSIGEFMLTSEAEECTKYPDELILAYLFSAFMGSDVVKNTENRYDGLFEM